MTEDTPLTNYGQKPRVRAEITRLWQRAQKDGLVRAVAVRASDFYGPDVPTSVLSTLGVAPLLARKPALAPDPPDQPHDVTYVPDFARALVTLIDGPDAAYGEAWHMPNAPTRSLHEVFTLAATLTGVRPQVRVLPSAMMPVIGLFKPAVRELNEMRFQWDRPYGVDATKLSHRFWSDAVRGRLKATIAFYRDAKR